MKYISLIICSSFLVGFFGCGEKKPESGLSEEVVEIDLSEAREAKLSEFFQSVSYTLLDYADELPIVNGYKMAFTEDKIFVESRETAQIFVFDKSGQVEHVIGKFGDGPEEFRLIDEMNIIGDTVRIVAKHLNKYLLFTSDGEFIEEEKLAYRGRSVHQKAFNLYYFQHGEGAEQWTYIREDKTGGKPEETVIGYLPMRKDFEKFNPYADPIGFQKDPETGQIFYTEPNDYLVQNFDSDGYFKRTIRFDFGKNNLPLKKRIELITMGIERYDYLRENNLVYSVQYFYPFKDLFFIVAGTSGKSNSIFMDKDFKSISIIQEWENDLDGMKLGKPNGTKSNNEIVNKVGSRTFFNDYLAAFNGKSVQIKPGNVHEFFEKNRQKLQEEKIVLVSYKLK